MAKKATAPKRPAQIKPEYTKHVCDECKHGRWVDSFSNLDWQRKPICLTCPFEQWHIIRGRQACAKFEPKPKEKEGDNE